MENNSLPYLVLRKDKAKNDWKVNLEPKNSNNGRKIGVNKIFPSKEIYASKKEWEPGNPDGKTPVIETGSGGIEIATFSHMAGQDCHKHLLGTEIYLVLEGKMTIRLNETDIVELDTGDEIVVLPNTAHEVLATNNPFLTRVHSINCYGEQDKYVKDNGRWCQIYTLKELKKS